MTHLGSGGSTGGGLCLGVSQTPSLSPLAHLSQGLADFLQRARWWLFSAS